LGGGEGLGLAGAGGAQASQGRPKMGCPINNLTGESWGGGGSIYITPLPTSW